jgi:choline dehydrogenase-like flavoprotein
VLTEAENVEAGATLSCDVCIIGAGPAGITIARQLAGTSLTVCLLEGGGLVPEIAAQRLYSGANLGAPYFRLDRCRHRMFGGSSNRWGGWCRPFDPIDYERRSWVPLSGWPIGEDAVRPYYQAAARILGLHSWDWSLSSWRGIVPVSALDFPPESFENVLFQFSPELNFGAVYRAEMRSAPRVNVLLHANAVGLERGAGSRAIRSVRAKSLSGREFRVTARAFVVATGGIEAPRLLLASRGAEAGGIGNEHGWVGRCFMDHPHVPLGHFVPSPRARGRRFYRKGRYGEHKVRGLVTASGALQRRAGLLGCTISIERAPYAFGTPYLEWPPGAILPLINAQLWLSRSFSPRLGAWIRMLAEFGYQAPRRAASWSRAARAAWRNGIPASGLPGAPAIYPLYLRSEQAPNPGSRVVLSDTRDALGSPRADVDWRLTALDHDTLWRTAESFGRTVEQANLGRVLLPTGIERERWKGRIIGGPHHVGTTRMSGDPRHGVVDENCRVHATDNLFVAGGAVFPTSGYANPMFMTVALSLRLGEHIRNTLA